ALNHDAAKKAVSLHFAGDGKRRVQVAYVVEAPIWKTSYRLVLDAEGKGAKPYLQGWAVVENPTDEDWSGVRMALISGRPISFKMDLYNPLYVERPTIEPELFASLRPPTYDGGFNARQAPFGNQGQGQGIVGLGGGAPGGGGFAGNGAVSNRGMSLARHRQVAEAKLVEDLTDKPALREKDQTYYRNSVRVMDQKALGVEKELAARI